MKAILIDPFTQTITTVELENTLPAIYAVLQCDTIHEVLLGHAAGSVEPLYALIDDEGLLKENQRGFTIRSAGAGFAGRMLLVSSNKEEYTDCPDADGLGVVYLKQEVEWLPEDFDFSPPEPHFTVVVPHGQDEPQLVSLASPAELEDFLAAFLSGTRH